MNILAAAAPTQPMPAQPAPYQPTPSQQQMMQQQQMQAYQQQMAMQEGRPVQKPSLKAQLINQGFVLFQLAVIIFFLVMVFRFVKATEKIANHITGAVPRKDDTPTQS
jgi:hypothetical protein